MVTAMAHATFTTPNYDFNDDAIPFGVGYWVKLVERYLPAS